MAPETTTFSLGQQITRLAEQIESVQEELSFFAGNGDPDNAVPGLVEREEALLQAHLGLYRRLIRLAVETR